MLRVLRLPKLFRVLRINKIGKMLDLSMKNYLRNNAQFKRFVNNINKKLIELINFIAILFLVMHLLACI